MDARPIFEERRPMKAYPTPWQRKTMWAALTALFVVFLIVIVGSVVWLAANLISFLQPILIPVAIAAILAYLLDPLVTKLCRGGLGRTKAVVLLFAVAFLGFGRVGRLAGADDFRPEREFCQGAADLYSKSARSRGRSDLPIRSHLWGAGKRPRQIDVAHQKFRELAVWALAGHRLACAVARISATARRK